MLGKTRRGCDVLKQLGWDAVCHSRLTPWPLVPQEVHRQTQACDTLPPLSRMRRPPSVSPRTRRYSEGSQPKDHHGKSGGLGSHGLYISATFSVVRLGFDYFINPRWEIWDDDVIE